MIRTTTRRLLLALTVAALALPLAAAPPSADPDPPPSFEPVNPLVQLWTAFQEFLGLDSDTTTSEPPTQDPQAGPYIDPHGGSGESDTEAGVLSDPHG